MLNKAMFPIYLVTAIVGGGLIVLSALGGIGHHGIGDGLGSSHDFDHGHDAHLGSDTDHADAPPGSDFWLPFFSLRFWTYTVGIFGVFGVVGTLLKLAHEPLLALVAGGTGLVMGLIAAYAMRWTKLSELDSAVNEKDLSGLTGKMLVAPRAGVPGKVRVQAKGETIDLLATPIDGIELEAGDQVVVIGIEGQRAQVARFEDYVGD